MLLVGLLFSWLFAASATHPPSPCPDVFAYEGTEPENNRWYGEISLRTDESLVGVRLDIELDRASDLMSWMGDISTSDNLKFTILNLNQKLRPGPPVLTRIMVKFNRTMGSPKIRVIRLNGRKICPDESSYTAEHGELTYPQKRPRPDPEFGVNYEENGSGNPANVNNNNNRPNAQFNNENRPSAQANNNNRPSAQGNNNNRPSEQVNNNNNNRPNEQVNNNRPNEQVNNNRPSTPLNNRPTSTPANYNNNYNRPNAQSNNNNNNNDNSQNPDDTTNVNNNNYRPVYKPPATTEEPYSATRKTTKTITQTTTSTQSPSYENNGYRPNNSNNNNNNNYNPNTVSLQAGGTNANGQINGVISELLNNENKTNKTVIITVIENNQQQPNRPNTADGGRPTATNSNRPTTGGDQQPFTNQRPTNNQGGGVPSTSSANAQQSTSSGSVSCGEVKMAVPLVTAGQSTHRGQWPWHVAMYTIEGINLSYHCGGSLVSKNKILTAAHCVTNKQNDAVMSSNKIVIYLGKYHQLQYSDETGVQTKQVIRINVFPSYNSSNYLGDVAVLTLSSNVEFTKFVTPVCLWDEDSDNLENIVGKEGTVVGWGYDENDTPTEELKMAKMPVVSHQTCLWSYPQFYSEFTSDKTFCAGFRNGTSVCNGDSGGGMVFSRNSRWYLRGIVSITVAKEGLRVCDTRHYVVFTDVAKYIDFIRTNLR